MVHKERERQPFKPLSYWLIILVIAMITTGAAFLFSLSRYRFTSWIPLLQPPQVQPTTYSTVTAVAALGRLEPQGEVIHLSAPNQQGGVRIAKLQVNKGDKVHKGQVVAILDNHDVSFTALLRAQKQVEAAQASLEQVKAGAKAGDIYAQRASINRLQANLQAEITTQQATIARLKAELRNAQTENNRYQSLYNQGAISASNSDSKRLMVDTIQQQLLAAQANLNGTVRTIQKQMNEAQGKLKSIEEVRPTDVRAAQTNVESAKAAVKQAQADLDLSIVRSPIDGQIMKIHTRPGEVIGSQGIVELGRTKQMYVVAEVYETDIDKVRLGQSATIISDAFSEQLRGKVVDIGLRVGRQQIFNNDPGADTDNRIVDVKIRIDPAFNQRVAAFTDLQVQVRIDI